jgi:uncharacterized protein YeeX (DUF496 family)
MLLVSLVVEDKLRVILYRVQYKYFCSVLFLQNLADIWRKREKRLEVKCWDVEHKVLPKEKRMLYVQVLKIYYGEKSMPHFTCKKIILFKNDCLKRLKD